jgi:hydrogenase maturation factor HypF (carbamoyltransferase family)
LILETAAFTPNPNACPECGPSLSNTLASTRQLLLAGEIVAIKGLGGYHLTCDATNLSAVTLLRERKRRSNKAFAVMAKSMDVVRRYCDVSPAAADLLQSVRSPIVLLEKRSNLLPKAIAPGNAHLGVMLPYTPLHHLLFRDGLDLLVMTSGEPRPKNRSFMKTKRSSDPSQNTSSPTIAAFAPALMIRCYKSSRAKPIRSVARADMPPKPSGFTPGFPMSSPAVES